MLIVLRTEDLSIVKVNQLPDEKNVGRFEWVNDTWLVFNSIRKFGRYAQPFGTGEWYGVNADGSQPPPSGVLRHPRCHPARKAYRQRALQPARNAAARRPERPDDDQYPRTSCTGARRTAAGPWSKQLQDLRKDVLGARQLQRRPDLRVPSDCRKPQALDTIDTVSGPFSTLFEDAVSEPSRLIQSADGETIIAVATEASVPRATMLDEAHPDAAIYGSLASAFPGQSVYFSSATRGGRQIVVSVVSDRNSSELYLYDRSTGKARFLMQGRNWLDPATMARVKPFSSKNRDGMTLYGHLTIPHGSDGKNLPLIVNPHGGPMGPRDDWAFNWETQLLASGGCLVMRVNYRGPAASARRSRTWPTGSGPRAS